MSAPPTVVLFVRLPVPGETKTRLAAGSSPERAANAARAMAEHIVAQLLAGTDRSWELVVFAAPGGRALEVGAWLFSGDTPSGVRIEPQPEGTLADRLEHAQSLGGGPVLFVGSDCPEIEARDIDDALEALARFDAVVGPAADGGFWLLGLRQALPGVFRDVPFSAANTLDVLLGGIRASGFSVLQLGLRRDVDTIEDWRGLPEATKAALRARALGPDGALPR